MNDNRAPLVAFLLSTFLVSWTAWGALAVLDIEPGIDLGGALWLLGGLGPPISAVLVTRLADGTQPTRELLARLFRWRVGWRWYAIAVLLPGAVVATALVVDAAVRGVHTPRPDAEFVLLFAGVFIFNATLGGGLEEIGWRGFALPRLQSSVGATTASLAVGAIWMLWHVPLFVVPGALQADLPLAPFVLQGIALSIVFTWLYNSTRGSLLLAVLLHASVNTWLSVVWVLREDVDPVTLWVMALLVCAIAVGLPVVYGLEQLSRYERQTA